MAPQWGASAVRPRWRRLGASSRQLPGGSRNGGAEWTCRPGTTSIWRSGCRGPFATGSAGRPAREEGLRPEGRLPTGSDRKPVRSLVYPPAGSRVSAPRGPTRGPLHIRAWSALAGWTVPGPGGPRLRGVGWSAAPRGEAPGSSLRATPPINSGLDSPIRMEFYRRAPAWCSPSLSGGGSPSRPVCHSPVLVRPARAPLSGARPALSGAFPKEGGRLWLLLSQGRTGKETQDEPPARGIQFRRSAPLVPGHEGLVTGHEGQRAGFPNKFSSRRPVCGKARCG